jgi:Xaa-Pro aminopeptidase
MWTDGRYYIQADKTLYEDWKMMKMERGEIDIKKYIKENLPVGTTIGVDTKLCTREFFKDLTKNLAGFKILHDEENLVDKIWENKPRYKKDNVIVHKLEFSGETCEKKFLRVKEYMNKLLPDSPKYALLITRLDDIAWLTNLRGWDIPYNPVFFAFAILLVDSEKNIIECKLFADEEKFNNEEIKKHLQDSNITLMGYNEIYSYLVEEEKLKKYTLISDEACLNQYIYDIILKNWNPNTYRIIEKNPVEYTKAIKTEREIQGFRECNLRDGAALVQFFAWLEHELITKNRQDLNEYEAALKSRDFRAQKEFFRGESFEAISATGPNASIIHYKPDKESSSFIRSEEVYLLDSGAQYLDGTTDTTRTVHFKSPSDLEKELYTRVLLGNLSVQRSRILKRWNPNGGTIDALARQYLWELGVDYLHGTGHGVGYFLNVHEGPHGIGNYSNNPPLQHGMVVTNEPGYYLKNQFGIRIENMLLVVEKDNLIGFENLTIVPYENNLLFMPLLSDDVIKFINDYHEECFNKLSPLIKDDQLALNYLKRKTEKILRPF